MLAGIALVAAAMWKRQEIDVYGWIGVILVPMLGMIMGAGTFLWTIDLPTIGGLVAVIGTSVDHQIIIADETLRGEKERRTYSMKEKIKRAFFIIFGAAATTIAAMLPLMFLGVGLVRGFAITTIVGVLVGILVTRPAYAKIVEAIFK
jgi:preprotein translocase subunit SecD